MKFNKRMCHPPVTKLGLLLIEVTLGDAQRDDLDRFDDAVELPD